MDKEDVVQREQDGGGVGDMKYISLHGYIRNTPSDTEVRAEHQLRQAGGPDQRKEYVDPRKTR